MKRLKRNKHDASNPSDVMTRSCGPFNGTDSTLKDDCEDFTSNESNAITSSLSVSSISTYTKQSIPNSLLDCETYKSKHNRNNGSQSSDTATLTPSLSLTMTDQLKFMDEDSSSSPATTPENEDPKHIATPCTARMITYSGANCAPFLPAVVRRCKSQENNFTFQVIWSYDQSEDDLAASCDPLANTYHCENAVVPPPPSIPPPTEEEIGPDHYCQPKLNNSRAAQSNNNHRPKNIHLNVGGNHDENYWRCPLTRKLEAVTDVEPIYPSPVDSYCHVTVPQTSPQPPNVSPNHARSETASSSYDGSDTESIAESIYHQPPKQADRNAAYRLAKRLYALEGFKVTDVVKHLCKRNDFSQLVGEEYLSFFDFTAMRLDKALRNFLLKFTLSGETGDRERVLHHFSRRYVYCNPGLYNSDDSCHTLVCALMLLNTDLHGHNFGRRMTCQDFVVNLTELNDGEDFSKDELVYLYNAIKQEPIKYPSEPDCSMDNSKLAYYDKSKQPLMNSSSSFNPFITIPSNATSKEYMRGFVMRKLVMESHGRKAPLGKRGWKIYFARLRDLILHLHKDAESAAAAARADDAYAAHSAAVTAQQILYAQESQSTAEVEGENCEEDSSPEEVPLPPPPPAPPKPGPMPEASIGIHHCLATRADDYTKKKNVFRLKTKDGTEYLIQTSNQNEVDLWVDTLNFVAALLSAPPLPGGCGSEKSFYRPLLPLSTTRLNIAEQLECHQRKILEISRDLKEHSKNPPKKSDKMRIKVEYQEKKYFLEEEILRYKTYARLLENELAQMHANALAPYPPYLIVRDPQGNEYRQDTAQLQPPRRSLSTFDSRQLSQAQSFYIVANNHTAPYHVTQENSPVPPPYCDQLTFEECSLEDVGESPAQSQLYRSKSFDTSDTSAHHHNHTNQNRALYEIL